MSITHCHILYTLVIHCNYLIYTNFISSL